MSFGKKRYALHRQIHFPTGVTHSVCAFFTRIPNDDTTLPNLILVRSTLLEVYEIGVGSNGTRRLELIESYPLNGVVESLVVLKNPAKRSQLDSIILTYREAKAAVVEWRTSENSLAVTSLHSFETERQNREGKEVYPLGPEAKTDPLGRCACVLFFENRLALLPTKDAEDLDVPITEVKATPSLSAANQAASVSGSYVLQLQTLGVKSVLDFVFLRGYNEPVLLLLHESSPTWAAQYRDKKDTHCLTAVSLNLKQKIYPVIWSVTGLPSDAYKLIPAPLAGALVLTMNFVCFYSQGQRVAVGVNSQAFAADFTQKMEPETTPENQTNSAVEFARTHSTAVHPDSAPLLSSAASSGVLLDVELDAAVGCWLNNLTLLLALKTGQLLLVQLILDRDSVKDITLSKCGGAPLVSSLTVVSQDLLFIGSCQGDSLLVKFNPLEDHSAASEEPVRDPRVPSQDDDFIFFSEEATLQSNALLQHQFSFNVIDSLLGIGPIRDMVTGAPSELDSSSPTHQTSLSPQLVCCVGTGRSGALAILRKGIVAEVLIEVPVPEIESVWALHYTEETEHLPVAITPYATNAFLVISTSTGTMVLRSGEELEEVSDNSDFETKSRTVLAGSVLEDTRLVQICEKSILLLNGTQKTQEISLQELLNQLNQDGAVIESEEVLMSPCEASPEPMETEEDPSQDQRSMFYDFGALNEDSFPADFLMEDKMNLMETEATDLHTLDVDQEPQRTGPWIQRAVICDPLVLVKLADGRVIIMEADSDSKTLSPLEAATEVMFISPTEDESLQITSAGLYLDTELWLNNGRESAIFKHPVFCLVTRMSGLMEIYALPHMDCILAVPCFSMGWKILNRNSMGLQEKAEEMQNGQNLKIVEIRMDCFSDKSQDGESLISSPFLTALLDDGTLLIYSAFRSFHNELNFRRLELDYTGDAAWTALHSKDNLKSLGRRPKLVPFTDMGEKFPCSGIFIAGVAPYFVIFSTKGVHLHRLLVDGPVSAMTPFSNINCPKGFILAMTNNQLKICTLHKERVDGGGWPYSKIPLRCTPNKVAWYPDAKLYLLLCSRSVLFRNRIPEEEGGDTHAAVAYAVSGQSAKEKGMEEGHELRIIIPGSWNNSWSFPLEPNEVGLAVKAVRLKNQSEDTTEAMVALGTGYVLGEDYPSTGRILLFEILYKNTELFEGKVVWCQDCRAPVNAVAVLDGSLLMGIGSRLELCSWNGSGLMRLAFFDAPVFITSVNVVKSFVLFGDFLKGIHFVWYTVPTSGVGGGHEPHGDVKEMVLLGKDFNNSDVYSTEFLVNGTTLRFIFADGGGNLHLQGYHRDHPDSWNGRKLIPEGSIHIGHLVTRMLRMRLCSLDGIGRQAAVYGTMEGSIGFLSPLWDASIFERLQFLQQTLVLQIQHNSGLNPISFRRGFRNPVRSAMCGSFGQLQQSPPDSILDLDLIWRFLSLDRIQQENLAQKSGVFRQQIIHDLQNISLTTSFF